MKKNHTLKRASLIVLTVIIAGVAAFAFPAQAAAAIVQQGETPPPQANADQLKQLRKEKLENLYQREQRLLEHLNADLERVPAITDKTETLVNRLEERGIDPTPVQDALNAFIQQANTSASLRDQAAAILAEHNGFNPQGKVTNVQDAAQTVRSAGKLLRDAHRGFHASLRHLRIATRDVIGSYLPKQEAQP